MLDGLLTGYILAASLVASLYFLKFWRVTRDRLFLAFAVAFAIEGLSRLLSRFLVKPTEGSPIIYSTRLVAYVTIVIAIIAKNRKRAAR